MRHILHISLWCLLLLAGCDTWRTIRPTVSTEVAISIPRFSGHRLPNGIQLYTCTQSHLPMVTVGAVWRAGLASAPRERAGLQRIVASMLALSDGATAQEIDRLGSELIVESTAEGALISMRVNAEHAEQAVRLLANTLRQPAFSPIALDAARTRLRGQIRTLLAEPRELAQVALMAALYGVEHRLSRPLGTLSAISAITPADVEQFQQNYLGPAHIGLMFAGQVEDADFLHWATQYFGDWQKPTQPVPSLRMVPNTEDGRAVIVPRLGLAQSVLAIGGAGVQLGSADEHPLQLAVSIVGNHLFRRLRQESGSTYDVSDVVVSFPTGGYYKWQFSVENSAAMTALDLTLSRVTKLSLDPLPRASIPLMRVYALWDAISALSFHRGVVGSGAALLLSGQPVDRYIQLVTQIPQTTPNQIEAVVNRYMETSQLNVAGVGDPALLDKPAGRIGRVLHWDPAVDWK